MAKNKENFSDLSIIKHIYYAFTGRRYTYI